MTVNYATGEITDDLTRNEAERLSIRISARLDTMADNYVAVMPMIREALTRQAHVALGYRSPGDYARERFGDALSKLDPAMRREVVQELTEAGMSTRAIAPVVGASFNTVARDARVSPDTPQTPESVHGGEAVTDSGQTPEPSSRGSEAGAPAPEVQPERVEPPAPRPAVTGIDGKTYPAAAPNRPRPSRKPLTDTFFEAVYDLGRKAESVSRLTQDDRFPQNADKVAAKHRNDLIRTRDLLTQVIEQLTDKDTHE